MRIYEGMFLIEAGRASRDWEGTESDVSALLAKHGAEILQANRYDERKLAFPVKGHRRGAYLLAYFEADPEAIQEMRTDLQLSESVLRSLIVKVPGNEVPDERALGTAEPMKEAPPASEEPEPEPAAATEEVAAEEAAPAPAAEDAAPAETPEPAPAPDGAAEATDPVPEEGVSEEPAPAPEEGAAEDVAPESPGAEKEKEKED
ncbi:MAG: 30S ribosomal protein S6 [Planctomycetota bacterium]|jgi:ribosomal protein S6